MLPARRPQAGSASPRCGRRELRGRHRERDRPTRRSRSAATLAPSPDRRRPAVAEPRLARAARPPRRPARRHASCPPGAVRAARTRGVAAAPSAGSSARASPSTIGGRAMAGGANSTTIARMCVPSVHAACRTSGGHATASPARIRVRSSPTPTQPPPSITMNQAALGLSAARSGALRANASSAMTPGGPASITWPSIPDVPGGPSGRRCPTPNRRTSIGTGAPVSGGGAGARPSSGSWPRDA